MEKMLTRRDFLMALAGGMSSLVFTTPADAQRFPRRRRVIRRRQRDIRRRALRRFRRRNRHLEEAARRAVRRGEIRRLREVMALVRQRSSAEILDVDLHKSKRGWVYSLRVLTARGRVRDVILDARTLTILRQGPPDRGGGDGVALPRDLAPRDELPPVRRNRLRPNAAYDTIRPPPGTRVRDFPPPPAPARPPPTFPDKPPLPARPVK